LKFAEKTEPHLKTDQATIVEDTTADENTGQIERVKLGGIRKAIAKAMIHSNPATLGVGGSKNMNRIIEVKFSKCFGNYVMIKMLKRGNL
jgi:pyruvate/2-oxoglutarate dehydrogenase complex dihydrolipoamide acyltransferase (E2) component